MLDHLWQEVDWKSSFRFPANSSLALLMLKQVLGSRKKTPSCPWKLSLASPVASGCFLVLHLETWCSDVTSMYRPKMAGPFVPPTNFKHQHLSREKSPHDKRKVPWPCGIQDSELLGVMLWKHSLHQVPLGNRGNWHHDVILRIPPAACSHAYLLLYTSIFRVLLNDFLLHEWTMKTCARATVNKASDGMPTCCWQIKLLTSWHGHRPMICKPSKQEFVVDQLVGGFNPFETYESNWESSPK